MFHGAGIVTSIYPIKDPNVDKYFIHGAYGYGHVSFDQIRVVIHALLPGPPEELRWNISEETQRRTARLSDLSDRRSHGLPVC